MGLFNELLINAASKAAPIEIDDYIGESGLRMCGKCHSPKERYLTNLPNVPEEVLVQLFGRDKKVPTPCKCRLEKMEAEDAEERRRLKAQHILLQRCDCFHNDTDAASTFKVDDRSDPQVSDAMLRYAEGFALMMQGQEDRYGLLIYGPVGTGKTFYAACVANYLLDQGFSVEMTSFTRIVNTIQGLYEGKQAYIDRLVRKDLLIIDDLGVERDSEFMQEQVTAIIDARYKSGRPLIVTTNVSLEEIKKPKDLTHRRMYDRLLEICHPIKVDGKSRRRASVMNTYAKRNERLGL